MANYPGWGQISCPNAPGQGRRKMENAPPPGSSPINTDKTSRTNEWFEWFVNASIMYTHGLKTMCVECLGVAPGYANAPPQDR